MNFRRKVQSGEKLGRKLGFPTLNFKVGNFGEYFEPGVYACEVKIQRLVASGQWVAKSQKILTTSHLSLATFKGALYFGPKGMGKNVLEIHVLNFSDQIYGEFVSFSVGKKIRKPKRFDSLEDLKGQIGKDVETVRG